MSGAASPKTGRIDSIEVVYQVAQLSIRRAFRGKRIFGALAVVLFPAALAILVASRARAAEHDQFFYGMLSHYHFAIAVPVVALTFSSAFPWPEAEEGTLTYWFTSPVRRWAVHVGRYVAALLVGMVILPLGVLAIALPLSPPPDADFSASVWVGTAATLAAYPAYLALFWLALTALRRGLTLCVLFIMVENFVSVFTGTIVKVTLIHYVRSEVVNALPHGATRFAPTLLHTTFEDATSTATCLLAFAIVTAVALGAALFLVESIEYRGKTAQPG